MDPDIFLVWADSELRSERTPPGLATDYRPIRSVPSAGTGKRPAHTTPAQVGRVTTPGTKKTAAGPVAA